MSATTEIDAILRDARALTEGMTREQFNRQPAPNKWSVGQNLEHIVLTGEPYLERIEAALDNASGKDVRQGWLGSWFARTMEPPPRYRIRTFKKLVPAADLDPEQVIREFEEFHLRMADVLARVEQAGARAAAFRSPYMPLMRLTVGQAARVLLAHSRRHLFQARQLL